MALIFFFIHSEPRIYQNNRARYASGEKEKNTKKLFKNWFSFRLLGLQPRTVSRVRQSYSLETRNTENDNKKN